MMLVSLTISLSAAIRFRRVTDAFHLVRLRTPELHIPSDPQKQEGSEGTNARLLSGLWSGSVLRLERNAPDLGT